MTTRAAQRFEVDTDGMRQLHENRRPHELIKELIQNVFDEDDATMCDVVVRPYLDGIRITVTDNGKGFQNISDAYTIMGETAKRKDPTKRGRFNLGEKEVVSVAIEAKVETVGTTVKFPQEGGREVTPNNRRRGTRIEALMPWSSQDAEELAQRLTHFKAPAHITFTINGAEPERPPITHTTRGRLPTVVQDEERGALKNTRRMTDIEISPPVGETGQIFEMGIPIQEVELPFDVNILQKVPMPPNRDTVNEGYLKRVYSLVLAQVHQDLEANQFSETWVREAIEDPEITEDSVKNTINQRYGEKVVTWSSNTKANMEAIDNGYQVIHPRSLSQKELQNMREKGGLQSANTVFSDRTNDEPAVDEGDMGLVARMKFREWVKELSRAAGFAVEVHFVNDPGARMVACCTMNSRNPNMKFNTHYLDETFFAARGPEQVSLVIHELGHAEANGATEHGPTWGRSCAAVAGRILITLLKEG